jgi:hypothetical protein
MKKILFLLQSISIPTIAGAEDFVQGDVAPVVKTRINGVNPVVNMISMLPRFSCEALVQSNPIGYIDELIRFYCLGSKTDQSKDPSPWVLRLIFDTLKTLSKTQKLEIYHHLNLQPLHPNDVEWAISNNLAFDFAALLDINIDSLDSETKNEFWKILGAAYSINRGMVVMGVGIPELVETLRTLDGVEKIIKMVQYFKEQKSTSSTSKGVNLDIQSADNIISEMRKIQSISSVSEDEDETFVSINQELESSANISPLIKLAYKQHYIKQTSEENSFDDSKNKTSLIFHRYASLIMIKANCEITLIRCSNLHLSASVDFPLILVLVDSTINEKSLGYLKELDCRRTAMEKLYLPFFILSEIHFSDSTTAIASLKLRDNNDINTHFPIYLTRINPNAFEYSHVSRLDLRETLITHIDPKSLSGFYKLTDFIAPPGLSELHEYTLSHRLMRVDLSNTKITTLESNVFSAAQLSSVLLPKNLAIIERSAFYKIERLSSISMPPTVTEIREDAFFGCPDLKAVDLSECQITQLDKIFNGCEKIESIKLPATLRIIAAGAFAKLAINDIEIPESVEEINYAAFEDCKRLERIDLSKCQIKTLSPYVFSRCDNLSEVILPETLEKIESYVFWGLNKIARVTIPKGVSEIYPDAFDGCDSLKEVDLSQTNITSASLKQPLKVPEECVIKWGTQKTE